MVKKDPVLPAAGEKVIGLLGYWVIGLLGYWVIGLLGYWVIGLLGYWVIYRKLHVVGGLRPAGYGGFWGR